MVELFDLVNEFVNLNGVPLSYGRLEVYYLGRTHLADTWSNPEGTSLNSQPIILDNAGMCKCYVSPDFDYTLVVKDAYGNEIFSLDKYIKTGGGIITTDVAVEGSNSVLVSSYERNGVTVYVPYITGGVGKTYTGIYPIDVNNTANMISADSVPIGVQDPLYIVQDDAEAFIIGASGLMPESASGNFYPMTGNPSGFLTAHQDISQKLDTTAFSTVSASFLTSLPADLVYTGELASVSSDITAQIPSTAGLASETYVDNKVSGKLDSTAFSTVSGNFLTSLPAGTMNETGFGYEEGLITGYNNSAFSAGSDTDPAVFVPWSASGAFAASGDITAMVTETELQNVSSTITGMIPSTAGLATESWVTSQGYLTAETDWTDTITAASANAYEQATAAIPTDYLTTADSANFYTTANESGFITGVDLTPYQTTAGMTAYQPAGDYLTTGDSSNFYTTANPSGFITGVDLTPYQTTAGMTAYATTGDVTGKLDTTSFSNVSGDFLTAVPEGYATESFVTSQGYITGSYLTADALDNVSGTWNTVTNKLDSTAFSTVSSNFLTAHQALPNSANWNATYNTVNGKSATWNSTYDTVHDNSASWTGGASVTSPLGTIKISGDQIEGTNSAVLTGTAGGYTTSLYAVNYYISEAGAVLTNDMLPNDTQTGGTLAIGTQGGDTSLYITITGQTFGGGTATASAQVQAVGADHVALIPLGEMRGPFSARSTYWANLRSMVLTASGAPTTGITGVGELAWNSALDSVRNTSAAWNSTYSTVAINSASWGAGTEYSAGSGIDITDDVISLTNPLTLVPSGDVTIDVTGNSAVISVNAGASYTGDAQGALDEVYSKSGDWNTVTNKLDTTAFSTVSGNFLTAHQALSNSGNWDSTYTAVSNNSATWATVTDKLNTTAFSTVSGDFLTAHQDLPNSGNWDATYTTVSTNSADWNSAAAMNELPVSAGEGMDIQNVDGNIVFSCTGGSVPEGVLVESGLEYDNIEISGYSGSAFKDVALSETVATNSGAWGGSALSISAGNGISLSMVDGVLVISVTGGN